MKCAACRQPIDPDPGSKFTVFTDGKAYDLHDAACLLTWAARRRAQAAFRTAIAVWNLLSIMTGPIGALGA